MKKTRLDRWGYVFVAPWIVGMVIFFIFPFSQSILFAFSRLEFTENGLMTEFIGLENIRVVLFEDPKIFQLFASSIGSTLSELVLVTTVSFFISIILNQKFFGRTFSRLIFSLPIIVSSGVLLSVFKQDLFAQSQMGVQQTAIFQGGGMEEILIQIGIGSDAVSAILSQVNNLVDMLWKSGVQIVIFLSGLQSIPMSYYEVCDIEGATSWQKFWRVVFPVMTPYVFLNIIYTIIDSFTYYSNPVMEKIMTYFDNVQYAQSTAVALVYFVLMAVITGLISLVLSKKIVYIDK